jgi:hypothetical protein
MYCKATGNGNCLCLGPGTGAAVEGKADEEVKPDQQARDVTSAIDMPLSVVDDVPIERVTVKRVKVSKSRGLVRSDRSAKLLQPSP